MKVGKPVHVFENTSKTLSSLFRFIFLFQSYSTVVRETLFFPLEMSSLFFGKF